MDSEQHHFEELRQENEALRAELDQIRSSRIRKRKMSWWFTRKAGGAFAGQWLRNSFLKLYREIPEQKVKKETLADVSASLLWRITRIGVITIFLALIPTAILLFQTNILIRQNKILAKQNHRLDQQTNLLEAERRSSLVYVMSSLMDQLDEETSREGGYVGDGLIARIAGLTQSLKPYRFLENDALTDGAWSPEKGQLFLNLILTEMNRNSRAELFQKTNFTASDLKGVEINLIRLADARLTGSRLDDARLFNCNWESVDLSHSSFEKAWIEGSEFNNCSFNNADLQQVAFFDLSLNKCNLTGSDLSNSMLHSVDFTDCNLLKTEFRGSLISDCSFNGSTDISGIDMDGAFVDDPQWFRELAESGVKGAEQLSSVYRVGKATKIDGLFGSHSEFERMAAKNQDKQFYIVIKK